MHQKTTNNPLSHNTATRQVNLNKHEFCPREGQRVPQQMSGNEPAISWPSQQKATAAKIPAESVPTSRVPVGMGMEPLQPRLASCFS